MSRYFAIFLLTLGLIPGLVEPSTVVLDAGFDAYVQQLLELLHVPGLSIAVVRRDSVESKGYGYAKLPDVEATADTLYYAGSTTKAFTAAAAALIVHDNIDYPGVSWSSPLSSLFSGDFALEDDYYTSHITLEDALSHRSGLPRHDLAYGWNDADPLDVIHTMRHLPLTAEPRTTWQYCNLMYATVGQALQTLSGMDFGDLLRKLIWKPVGMTSTTTSLEEAQASVDHNGQKRLSRGYHWNKDHYLPEPYPDIEALVGAGAVISSVNDYALWVQTLLNAGSNDSSPINDDIYRDVTGARAIINDLPGVTHLPIPPLYALGWINTMLGSHTLISHGGSVTGFGADVYILPDQGLGIVSMANTMGTSNQAGALTFLAILKKLGIISRAQDTAHLSSLYESITSFPQLNQQHSKRASEHVSSGPRLPLPGHITEHIGLYQHPAYGVFNVSLIEDKPAYHGRFPTGNQEAILSTSAQVCLHVQPSKRTWPIEFTLNHESGTLFASEIFWVHGQGDVGDECAQGSTAHLGVGGAECRQEVFSEHLFEARAVFERGLNGEVTKLGMELEPTMMVQTDSDWRDGMIWFEKHI